MPATTMIPPPAYALAAAAVQRLLTRSSTPTRGGRIAGLTLAAGSFAFSATAIRLFHARGTTEMPFRPEEASVLVTDGPYTCTRNPMYVALAGMLLGHAIVRRSRRALLPLVVYVAVVDRLQIPAEERALHATFGDEYDAYRSRVPRWVGPRP